MLHAAAIAFLIIMCSCLPARCEPATGSTKAAALTVGGHVYREQGGDLPNFHKVHPYLYRGGEPTAEGLKKLKDLGVTTIIDLRGDSKKVAAEAAAAKQLAIESINLPMSSRAPTQHQIDTFLSKVDEAAQSRGSKRVFVHCAHGSDRTGCMVGIWRVTRDNFSYDKAYKEMRRYYFSPKFTELSGTVRRLSGSGGPTSR